MQRRHDRAYPKSRSELFNSHKNDEQRLKETRKGHMQNPPERISNSGPLAPGVGWRSSGRKNDKTPVLSSRNDVRTLSGLMTSRALSSVEYSRDKLISSHVEATNQVDRLSESFGYPMRKRDRRHQSQIFSASQQSENGRINQNEAVTDINGHKERKIHFSGPLIAPSNNIEQVLKEHERRIQEAARYIRHEKTRADRVRPQELHQLYVSDQSIG
ncbi:hypothetical protein CDL12_12566 [Handroanthus impetiginosus]|uniref:Uncharacterized protein n=1 Tax=Handroanthus impetiginosus TaxID=429701 RepID=A0A2G9HB90_9LAMI|nr:hypothetical protein CDL12_12566 [Handroanthus impetiginosus]